MTYIYKELTAHQVAGEILQGTQSGFSRDGALALARHLEEYAENTGEPIELDVIALRCEFSEYASLDDVCDCYDDAPREDDHGAEAVLDWFRDQTTVIKFDGGIIVQDF